jgi:ligand-binding SRPBCC domain-containing protein
MQVYESRIVLPGPAERVFDFLIRPANMQQISPPEVQMAFIEAPEVISLGSKLVFKIQVYGQVQQFEHEIVEFDRPNKFREKAVVTPMKSWIQDYILEPGDSGSVVLYNRIEFEPPGGVLGFIVTPQLIMTNLEEGHPYRQEALLKALQ